jgi:signal transduction histidine kinase
MKLLRRGVISQLILLILPLNLLLIIVPLGSLALHQQAMRELVGERDERAARSVAKAITEQLDHRLSLVRGLALQVSDTSPSNALTVADYMLNDFDGGLAVINIQGEVLASRGAQIISKDRVLELLPELTSEPVFSPLFGDTVSNEKFLLAIYRRANFVVVGSFSATKIIHSTVVDAFMAGEHGSAFVTDQHHQIIYETGATILNRNLAVHPGVNEALNGQSGTTYVQDTDSIAGEHVVAYSPVAPVNWALILEENWEHVDNPLLRATQFAPLILIPPLLLAVLALWFGINQIVRPLQALATKAAQLGQGHFKEIEQSVGGVVEIQRLQTELVQMAHKVEAAQDSLHDYISAITTGQEEERRRLARELHDDTLQSLIALNQRIQLAQLTLADSALSAQIAEIQTLIEQTTSNLRRVTRALRPIYLEDLGLVTALDMLARETSTSDLSVQFQQIGQERRLSAEVELALYRMAQEALNNVVRHAQATSAMLTIQFEPNLVSIRITDNGCGFIMPEIPSDFAQHGHFGLLGLHERAELIGATLDIQSSSSHGTRIAIRLAV